MVSNKLYKKNVSQLLLVHSGYHTPIFQYADNSRTNASVLHYSRKDGFNVVD